jgi:hypothetical protein
MARAMPPRPMKLMLLMVSALFPRGLSR